MFPQLARFTDVGLLLLRLMVGLVFVTSGYSDLKEPAARAKSIGMSKPFTIFLGTAEVAGGLGVAFGVLTSLRPSVSSSSCWAPSGRKSSRGIPASGEKGSGWHYELMLILMNLIIAFTDGRAYVLMK